MTPPLIKPRPEFCDLTESEISRALADPDATNPVVAEAARLIAGYVANLRASVDVKAHWPIEAVAIRLVMEARADALKNPELSMMPKAIIRRARRKN